jgi:hypothetical protein
VVSRTVLSSVEGLREVQRDDHGLVMNVMKDMRENHEFVMKEIKELREAQSATDEKLHALIDTVDRIIRNRNL